MRSPSLTALHYNADIFRVSRKTLAPPARTCPYIYIYVYIYTHKAERGQDAREASWRSNALNAPYTNVCVQCVLEERRWSVWADDAEKNEKCARGTRSLLYAGLPVALRIYTLGISLFYIYISYFLPKF